MKLSLPRAFCCVLYAVCWLDTTSTFYQKSNDESEGDLGSQRKRRTSGERGGGGGMVDGEKEEDGRNHE